jgi:hypothetical protein
MHVLLYLKFIAVSKEFMLKTWRLYKVHNQTPFMDFKFKTILPQSYTHYVCFTNWINIFFGNPNWINIIKKKSIQND